MDEYGALKTWLRRHGSRRFKVVSGKLMCTCPFHEENNPSFGILMDQQGRGWFKCFSAGCEVVGWIGKLVTHLEGPFVDPRTFLQSICFDSPIPDVESSDYRSKFVEVEVFNECILDEYNIYSEYWEHRGINRSTIQKFKLGYSPERHAVVIPVRRIGSRELVGLSFRFADSLPDFPQDLITKLANKELQKYFYLTGTRPAVAIFGQETILDYLKPVYLFEGALDAMLFHQNTGEQALARWGTMFSDLHREFLRQFLKVCIVADNDVHGAGQTNARATYRQLVQSVDCHCVTVPSPYKDYSEMCLAKGPSSLIPLSL